jgi:hypothetical protein
MAPLHVSVLVAAATQGTGWHGLALKGTDQWLQVAHWPHLKGVEVSQPTTCWLMVRASGLMAMCCYTRRRDYCRVMPLVNLCGHSHVRVGVV